MASLENSPAFENLHSDEKIKKFYGEDATFSSLVLGENSNNTQKLHILEAILAAGLDEKDPEKFGKLAEDIYENIGLDDFNRKDFRRH